MIYSLNGKLIASNQTSLVVECGGVGYLCTATANTLRNLPSKGENVFIYTYMSVREDAVDLYGFLTKDEKDCFKLLTSVNGLGPKIGIAMLSDFTPENVYLFIASGDHKSITKASGVGPKLAQRIVLELKDKVGSVSADNSQIETIGNATENSSSKTAVAALVSLGYTQSEAALAVGKQDQNLTVEQLIKASLKILARRV